jgi:nitrogen fixation NifU-like protein
MDFDHMVEELQQEIVERERALYSDVVLREARAPKNMGRMADADWHGVVRGWCGDTMEIYLRLGDGSTMIEEATFVTDGCGATLACGSLLTQMVTGLTLERAEWILPKDLINALGGLPEESMHCAGLAISTLQNALFNWRVSKMEEEEREEAD